MTVLQLVDRERARLRRLHVLVGATLAIGATCLVLALGASVLGGARWMALPRAVPFLVWVALILADAAVVWWTVRRLSTRATRNSVAAAIEREQSMRAGALRGVIEVADSGALGRKAAAAMSQKLEPARGKLAPRETRGVRRVVLQAAAVAIVAALALGWTAPTFNDGMAAIIRPVNAWQGTLLPKITFRNLPPEVLRGEILRLDIAAAQRSVVTLSQRVPGEGWKTETVSMNRQRGTGSIEIGPLRGDLTIVATDGRSVSDTAVVHVTDRPFVGAVSMRATYPSYLGRAPEGLPIGEPARVPQGTVIDVAGRASTALTRVRLANTGDTMSLQVNDRTFSGRFEARKGGRWSWIANGVTGPIPDVPLPIELEVVPDSAPRIELVSPAMDTIVASDDRVALRATVTDDHGIAFVELQTWRQPVAGWQQPPVSQRLSEATTTVWDGSTVLDLAPRGLHPGDALHVKIVAADNSPWGQRTESRELLLKIPTMEERRAIARASADSAVSQARTMAQAQKALEQRTGEAQRDGKQRNAGQESANNASGDKQNAMSYDAAEKAKAVAKDQRAMAEEVKKLQEAAASLERQLKQAGALDSSLARQLQEAQSLLKEALTPELLAQMKKLEDATQQLSRDQSQMALKDLQAMQQRLREQLEKTGEMLKRAAMEGAMETLKDEAKEIAERERKLAESSQFRPSEEDKSDAKKLADRTDRFSDELKKLQDRLQKEKAEPGAKNTEQARKHADASEQSMRQAASGANKPDSSGSRNQQNQQQAGNKVGQNAKDAAEQMDRAADAMKDARQQQVDAWKSELTQTLDQAIQEMLQMARQESQLEQKARSGQSKPEELRGEQSAVKQGVDNAAQKLQQEGQKTSLLSGRSQRAMSEAQQKVGQATQSASESRAGQQAANAFGDAADALNKAAASLARDREKANTSNSATGFAEMLQQLQEMAKKQGSINAQAAGLMPGPTSPQMSSEMQGTARALARQQRQIAEQLDELGDGAGGDRAAQLAKEAKQLAEALEGGRIDGTTLARQQQLFRRLLDAGRSLEKEEREDTNKREAQAAKAGNDFKPDNTNASGRAANKFREPTWDELRGLSADERRAILEYFKRINAKP
jgi:hypothetical protein